MTAPIRSMPELLDALRLRRDELGLTHETIDAVAGLQSGYASKLLAPKPIKNLGPMSFSSLLGALGVAVVLVEDEEQIKRIRPQWKTRLKPLKRTASITASIECEVPIQIAVTPAIKLLLDRTGFMRTIASTGGKARAQKLSPRKRQAIARKAIRARWKKRRERERATPAA